MDIAHEARNAPLEKVDARNANLVNGPVLIQCGQPFIDYNTK